MSHVYRHASQMMTTTKLVVEPLANEDDTAALIRMWSQLPHVPQQVWSVCVHSIV
jgi:hypothetical protein